MWVLRGFISFSGYIARSDKKETFGGKIFRERVTNRRIIFVYLQKPRF